MTPPAANAAADSWATDGHKWLQVPHDCGYAIVRDAEAHRRAMTSAARWRGHWVMRLSVISGPMSETELDRACRSICGVWRKVRSEPPADRLR